MQVTGKHSFVNTSFYDTLINYTQRINYNQRAIKYISDGINRVAGMLFYDPVYPKPFRQSVVSTDRCNRRDATAVPA